MKFLYFILGCCTFFNGIIFLIFGIIIDTSFYLWLGGRFGKEEVEIVFSSSFFFIYALFIPPLRTVEYDSENLYVSDR